jgi:hypothetical protein
MMLFWLDEVQSGFEAEVFGGMTALQAVFWMSQ